MIMNNKRIISAAITGAIHVRSMSSYLPVTPEEIADDAVKAAKAGAAIVHIHARHPETGEPSSDIDIMRDIIRRIKRKCNAIINISTGASQMMTSEERLSGIPALKPEIASCNAGSVNFMIADMAEKVTPLFDWELKYINGTRDNVFANTFLGIQKYIETMNEHGTKPEFEIYDSGMINNIAYFVNRGIIKKPIDIQFVLGIMGGAPATVENLCFFKSQADRLLNDYVWSAAAAGKFQLSIAAASLALGGNARVGLEDSLYIKPGILAKSSAEQVMAVKSIAETLGLEIATSDEAREILDLKGMDKVNF